MSMTHRVLRALSASILLVALAGVLVAQAPQREAPAPPALPRTPLAQHVLDLLANEISGQVIFNNEVRLAGAPWLRDKSEFDGTLYEAQKIYDLVRSYGIETTRLERSSTERKVDYPMEGELWITAPEKRLVARLDADSALVASGSSTADVTGQLAYIHDGKLVVLF